MPSILLEFNYRYKSKVDTLPTALIQDFTTLLLNSDHIPLLPQNTSLKKIPSLLKDGERQQINR
jgi:hypothetical protein